MRRLLSILLVLAFGLPTAASAFAQMSVQDESNLPACCRRGGAHHCAMTMAERAHLVADSDRTPHFSAKLEKCPYCPATTVAVHAETLAAPGTIRTLNLVATHPSGVAQTESRWRIARDRSRQKRGPPQLI